MLQVPQGPCEALEELGVVWRECPISQAFSFSFRGVLPVVNYHVLSVFQALVYLVMGLFPAEPWVHGTQLYVLGGKGQEGPWARPSLKVGVCQLVLECYPPVFPLLPPSIQAPCLAWCRN